MLNNIRTYGGGGKAFLSFLKGMLRGGEKSAAKEASAVLKGAEKGGARDLGILERLLGRGKAQREVSQVIQDYAKQGKADKAKLLEKLRGGEKYKDLRNILEKEAKGAGKLTKEEKAAKKQLMNQLKRETEAAWKKGGKKKYFTANDMKLLEEAKYHAIRNKRLGLLGAGTAGVGGFLLGRHSGKGGASGEGFPADGEEWNLTGDMLTPGDDLTYGVGRQLSDGSYYNADGSLARGETDHDGYDNIFDYTASQYGAKDRDTVRNIQRSLIALGYLPEGADDGKAGQMFTRSIADLQNDLREANIDDDPTIMSILAEGVPDAQTFIAAVNASKDRSGQSIGINDADMSLVDGYTIPSDRRGGKLDIYQYGVWK